MAGLEWQARREAKGISKPEYWSWLDSVTTVTGSHPDQKKVVDYSKEDYTIVETEVDEISFNASGHIASAVGGIKYHLKWDGSKVVADDDALAECQLAEKWKRVRLKRSRLLAETDYLALKDNTLSASWKEYRQALRDIPTQKDPDKITWPTKPS